MEKYTYLKEPEFNTEAETKKVQDTFKRVEDDIKQLNKLAEEKQIYITIQESREKEKALGRVYPYLHNTSRNVNVYNVSDAIKNIEYEYYNRIQTALYSIGFVSLNEKTKIIKCKKPYFFSDVSLYYLTRIAEFQTNLNNTGKDSDSIEIIKEYQNLNIEFKFKNDADFETFKALVYYGNDKTAYIINNAPDDLIIKYKDACKQKYINEVSLLYEFCKDKGFRNEPINRHLINKCWGV